MKRAKPIVILQNNTGAVQPVSLFTGNPNQTGGLNASPTYAWNVSVTGFANLTDLVLQVRVPGGSFTNLAARIATSTLAGLLDALNSLNVGNFYAVPSGADILVTTANSFFVFGNLTINQNNSAYNWNVTGGLQVNNPAVTTAASIMFQVVRSSQILGSNGLGPLVPPVFIPMAENLPFSPAQLTSGDTIQLQIVANPGVSSISVLLTRDGGIVVLNATQVTGLLTLTFPYVFDAFYDVAAQIN